jgi:hypothetical protein
VFTPLLASGGQEKLASVPCFVVTNRGGSPYLVALDTGYDVAVVFLDHQDAEEMAQEMMQVGTCLMVACLVLADADTVRGGGGGRIRTRRTRA